MPQKLRILKGQQRCSCLKKKDKLQMQRSLKKEIVLVDDIEMVREEVAE